MVDLAINKRVNVDNLLSRLRNFIGRNKISVGDVVITGPLACEMHDISGDSTPLSDVVHINVKRKTFMKLASPSESTGNILTREGGAVYVIRNDEFLDTLCLDGYKVISLNQIVKDLKSEPKLLHILNNAKDKLEGQVTTKFEDVKKPRNGISDREGMKRRLMKDKRFNFDRPGRTYKR